MNRPLPKEEDLPKILNEIDNINVDNLESYDHLNILTTDILNKFCPNHTPVEKTKNLYRNPLTKKTLKAIREKHYLKKQLKSDPSLINLYKKKRNLVTKLTRANRQAYQNNLLKNTKDVHDINRVIKVFQSDEITNINSNPDIIKIENKFGKELSQAMGKFYKERAENLVTVSQIEDAGPPGPVLRPGEELPNTFEFEFPYFDNFYDFVPKNKVSNAAGPDSLSSAIIEKIWPSYKHKLNYVTSKFGLQYPSHKQGYFQRTIPKTDDPKILKDLSPLGILNAVPKYCFNKPFFKNLREHITPILNKRNNYSYRGAHLCIIKTFDKIIEKLNNLEFVILTKYDYSNAFGCTYAILVLEALSQINLSQNSLNFLKGHIYNQGWCRTLISDKQGFHLSDLIEMLRGQAQGQIGADIIFIIQQLVLIELAEVFRTLYIDDLNDVISKLSQIAAIDLCKANEAELKVQSTSVGFMLNEDKTTYINFNLDDQLLIDNDMEPIHSSSLLGFPFSTTKTGVSVEPAVDMILKRLNYRSKAVFAAKNYLVNNADVVKILRKCVYYCIGELHLVVAYDTKSKFYPKIKAKVYNMIRSIGFDRKTPTSVLDQVFGCDLDQFARDCIIINGLKTIGAETAIFGRQEMIKYDTFTKNSYMSYFRQLWLDLSVRERKKLRSFGENFDNAKEYLKKLRKLEYCPSYFEKYKWVKYN